MLRVSNTKQEYGSWTAITRNMHLVLDVAIDFHPGVGLVVLVGVVLRSHQRVLGLGHQGKSCKDSDSKQTKGTKDGDSKHYAPQMTAITFSDLLTVKAECFSALPIPAAALASYEVDGELPMQRRGLANDGLELAGAIHKFHHGERRQCLLQVLQYRTQCHKNHSISVQRPCR